MIEGIALVLISLFVLFAAIATMNKIKRIKAIGQKTEGIIFDKEASNTTVGDTTITYPIVRFLTLNKEWITQKSSVSIIPGFYKKGEKVTVVYNPSTPTDFFIQSSNTYTVITILILVSVALIITGSYILLSSI